ncbi:MAG TPA: hypothetical protein VH307_30325 [Streptosporangiaceae bacterium]|nr:hypothetical protein [Streptosporangiaceae bacterium]
MSSETHSMRAMGWSNGQPLPTGAGYGVRLSDRDRDDYFDPGWHEVVVALDQGETALVLLSKSFWRSCPELRSAAIGRWLLRHHLAPWPRGLPPALVLHHVVGNRFELRTPQ